MQGNSINENDKRNQFMAHFKKINIFGNSNVGKSSLISSIEKYLEKDFKIGKKEEDKSEKSNNTDSLYITEQIKRINLEYDSSNNLYLALYETNTDKIDFIKEHIDTLVTYSECLIFMIDITSINTFNSLSELLPLISELNKDKNKYFPPMIFISNKTDLDSSREVSGFEIKELVDKYPGMLSVELSLLERDSFNEFMKQFVNTLKKEEQKNIYDFLHLVKIQDPPLLPGKKEEENTNDNDLSLNLFLLGSSGVGKTTFIKKFLKFNFFENSLSTLGIDVEKTLAKVGENFVKIELWDTAGQERLRSIPKRYYSKGDGFLLLYDVCSKSSFEDVSGWIKDIREARGTTGINGINDKKNSDEVLFLIGNKIDDTKKREVKKEDAKKMAEEYGVSYFEISCKDGVNVYEILSNLIFEAFSRAKGTNKNFKLNNQNTQKVKKKICCN